MKRIRCEWGEVTVACKMLAGRLQADEYDSIVGISRGGLIPATIIAETLNVRELRTVGVRSYGLRNNVKLGKPILYQMCTPYLRGRVLLVDDISDTGDTFEFILSHFRKNQAIANVTTCSLYVRKGTTHVPNYYHTEIVGKDWVVFPWEIEPST